MSIGKVTRQERSLLYGLYSILGTIFHVLLVLLKPLFTLLLPGWHISRRLGRYPDVQRVGQRKLVWIHAASVGEIQAARVLIHGLRAEDCPCSFFLTTMTIQGRDVAAERLPADVRCELAPVDTPQAVAQGLRTVEPDLYICLETELWPVMLSRLRQAGIPMLLLNGRMSTGSCRRYQRIRDTMAGLLAGFSKVAVISARDGECYRLLGVARERIVICGNMKYDLQGVPSQDMRARYQRLLCPAGKKVFICGSTRSGEEELLLPVFIRLQEEYPGEMLWVLAPRHLERLAEVGTILAAAGLEYSLLSRCEAHGRSADVVLVDTMGDLAGLYGLGDFNFCGGSLVDKGGHNIMEPVLQNRPVYFGPHMDDFQDAVETVLGVGAGFQVVDSDHLAELLIDHMQGSGEYRKAEKAAIALTGSQRRAVGCQVDLVRELLTTEKASSNP